MWNPFKSKEIVTNIIIQQIKSDLDCKITYLSKRDKNKIIVTIPVGNLPKQKSIEYMENCKNILLKFFPEITDILVLPIRGDDKSYSIQFVTILE